MPKLNYKIIFHLMGLLLLFNGGFMLIAALVSFLAKDGVGLEVSAAALLTAFAG
ncbi:MAG: TrkH family potassium uptake protein, partial [Dokdonia donghaensis]|nr:TrkH family potassium uptake protein [Dokdonia donghaensis]